MSWELVHADMGESWVRRQEADIEAARERECAACSGNGFQSGAHTERVEDCPECGGSGA